MSPYRHIHPLLGLRPWRLHSFVLAVAALIYMGYGSAVLAVPADEARAVGLEVALAMMPMHGWGLVWIVVGVLALVSSRWPLTSERWGYVAMSSLAALWASFYALAIVLLDAPHDGIYGLMVWALVAFLWWGISGLRNPEDVLTGATTTEGA